MEEKQLSPHMGVPRGHWCLKSTLVPHVDIGVPSEHWRLKRTSVSKLAKSVPSGYRWTAQVGIGVRRVYLGTCSLYDSYKTDTDII